MRLIPKYLKGSKTKYVSAARDANTGETYDVYLQDGNTYDSNGNSVSVISAPDTVITPHTRDLLLSIRSFGTKEPGLENVYPEFDLITLGLGLLSSPKIASFMRHPTWKTVYHGSPKPKLTSHLQGDDAVKMFREYGGTPIPKGSINGDLLRMYVNEARERYGLVGNNNITDEEIAQALYKHTNELGKGSAAVNSLGEPLLLFRGDTKAYTLLKPRATPELLYELNGTMDNSLGTLYLGEMPKGSGGDLGVAKYLNTATTTKAMPGTEPLTVFRPSQTGGSLEFDGKTWKGIYDYPSTLEKNTKTPVIVPEDASFLYSGKNGLYSVYKLPSRMATSGVNEINGFVVRTPAVRDMSLEMQVLEPAAPVQYADKFNWLTKERPKLIEDKDGFPLISYKGKESSGLASNHELGVVRELYKDLYSLLLKEAKEQNLGLLYSRPNTILRREHNNYPYFAIPNWNLKNAKHILPYDLRIPRDWSDPNIFRVAAPIGVSLPFLNNSNK